MRSPHTPQPTVNLGDDPDPAAELGPRLAAASQTAQGLLTNYLFYGQRRTADTAHARSRSEAQQRVADRGDDVHHTAGAQRSTHAERTQGHAERGRVEPAARTATPGGPAHSPGAPDAPKLRLVEVRQLDTAPGGGTQVPIGPCADALADDPLTHDALGRDPLAPPHHPQPKEERQRAVVSRLP